MDQIIVILVALKKNNMSIFFSVWNVFWCLCEQSLNFGGCGRDSHYLRYSLGKRTRLAFYFLVFMFLAFHCVILPVTEFRGGDFEIVFTRLFIVLSRFLSDIFLTNDLLASDLGMMVCHDESEAIL